MDEIKSNSFIKEALSWIKDIVIVLIIVWIITTFIGQKTYVKGQSMQPTLHNGDHVIINKISYRFSEPRRYDIVVFPYQKNPEQNYIKRIIGLPGDEVNIQNGKVYINGNEIDEKYEFNDIKNLGDQKYPLVVPEGQYFVMGDNRNNSSDSRYTDVGTIIEEDLIGKAALRIWPMKDFGIVK